MNTVVIGAGIAGASTAYFLAQGGANVTVVDAEQHTASHVPSALVNPVRGQSGGVDAQALAGMGLTWGLVRDLEARGFAIPHGQGGVLRPVPDDRARARFERNLPPELAHAWLKPEESPEPLAPGWAHVLSLPGGGWVDGQAFTAALVTASGARVIQARAHVWTAQEVHLSSGTLKANAVVFCGGSVGAYWAGDTATHRMGTLLKLNRAVTALPVSFGAYLAPARAGGVLGATFEPPAPDWHPEALPLPSLGWLLGKGLALTDLRGTAVTGRWTGSRLSGLKTGRQPDGTWRLTGLSSKGFLLGPLLARDLAAGLLASRAG